MKMTKEIEEFLNLAITEHMGKAYTDWKLKQQTDTERHVGSLPAISLIYGFMI